MELLAAYIFDKRRRRDRIVRAIYTKNNQDFLAMPDETLIKYYRFPRHVILEIVDELDEFLMPKRRVSAVPTYLQLLVTLRFFASGNYQTNVGLSTGISQSTISRIIDRVIQILYEKAEREIKMPDNAHEIQSINDKFYAIKKFPKVIGAIACSHIPIKTPHINESAFVNQKHYYSLKIQVVSDPEKNIMSYCARFPGSSEEEFIWSNSYLKDRFEYGEFGQTVLLGDTGYTLEECLMTPITNPSNPAEIAYNESHKETRAVVDQMLDLLKSRFLCLHQSKGPLQYNPGKCAKISVACFGLHNLCNKRNIPLPKDMVEDDRMIQVSQTFPLDPKGIKVRDDIMKQISC